MLVGLEVGALVLADADADVEGRAALPSTLNVLAMRLKLLPASSVIALGLGDLAGARLERRVAQLENQPERPLRQHARRHEVARHRRLVARKERDAAAAARLATE